MSRSLPPKLHTLLTFFLLFLVPFTVSQTPADSLGPRAARFGLRQILPSSFSNPPSATPSSASSGPSPSPSPSPSPPPPPPPPPRTSTTPSARPAVSSQAPTTTSSTTSTSISRLTTTSVTPLVAAPPIIATARTTFVVTDTSGNVDPTETAEAGPTDTPVAASGKPFWQNTGAVAATFSLAGLAVLGVIFAGATYAIRRRSQARQEAEEYFDKYPEPNATDDNVSVQDITSPAPAGAYPDRQVHYGDDNINSDPYSHQYAHQYDNGQYAQQPQTSGEQYAQQQQSYGEQYPQGYTSGEQQTAQNYGTNYQSTGNTTYAEGSTGNYQHDTSAAYATNAGQASTSYGQAITTPGQTVYPAASNGRGLAASPFAGSALRNAPGRDSYQQSIDSFYGGAR